MKILFEIGLDVYLDGAGVLVITRMLPNSVDVETGQDVGVFLKGINNPYGERIDYIEVLFNYDYLEKEFKSKLFFPSELGGGNKEILQLPRIKSKARAKDTVTRYFRRKINNLTSTRILKLNRSLESVVNVEMFKNEIVTIAGLDLTSVEIQQQSQEILFDQLEANVEALIFDVIFGNSGSYNDPTKKYNEGVKYL